MVVLVIRSITKISSCHRHLKYLLMPWYSNYSSCNSGLILEQDNLCICRRPQKRTMIKHNYYIQSVQQIRPLSSSLVVLKKQRTAPQPLVDSKKKLLKVIQVWRNITVEDLGKAMNRSIDHVFEVMIYVKNTDMCDHPKSQIDDVQVIREIVQKSGLRSQIVAPPTANQQGSAVEIEKVLDLEPRPIVEADLAPRSPVVAIMGHIDHGKTTTLDALRNTRVAQGEAGGITQHIGAFQVEVENGKQITFLDTPGHAAFYALRNRGAQATDIVVLVVAADDGVMEQTRESLQMIRAANVPMIVAINKIDKGDADIERTKRMLLQEGIQLEDFGGDVQSVAISALKGTNLDGLIDAIFLQAELMNLKSENKGMIEGIVIESKIDHGRGKICSALIQRGVLRRGAVLAAGTAWCKVRGIFGEHGSVLSKAGPSTPVEIIGWRELPAPGDRIIETDTEKRAKEVVDLRSDMKMKEKQIEDAQVIQAKTSTYMQEYRAALEEKRKRGIRYKMRRQGPREKEIKEDTDLIKISVIVKGDVDGSVEAFLDVLETYDCHHQCELNIVHYGVGDITETDIKLAEAFSAHIYGFNVSTSNKFEKECEAKGIKVHLNPVIYRLVEALKKDIEGKLPPQDKEETLGEANVLMVFNVTEGKKKIPIAGSRCTKGLLKKDAKFRLLRGEDVIYDGLLSSMKHLKADVNVIKNGVECGLGLEDISVVPKDGDVIRCYHYIQIPQFSQWNPGF